MNCLTDPQIQHIQSQLSPVKLQSEDKLNLTPKSSNSSHPFKKLRAQHTQTKFQRYVPHDPTYTFNQLKLLPETKLKIYKDSAYFGQFLNGQKNGRGLILYDSGRAYEGELVNDRKHGRGCEILPDGAIYYGGFINGKPEGLGKFTWPNGETYDGEWLTGLKHGQGMWKGVDEDTYMGEWKCGKADGYGVHVWVNGDKYEGQLKNCLKYGEGKEYFSNGDVYSGSYVNGKPEGYGEYNWANKTHFRGLFKNGLRHGLGYWQRNPNSIESETYEGEYVNDKKCGYGVYRWGNGNMYKGNFFDDLRHGYGEMKWSDCSYYKGMWDLGYQNGEGEIKTSTGEVRQGFFEKNKLVSDRNEDKENNSIDFNEQMNVQIKHYSLTKPLQITQKDSNTVSILMPNPFDIGSMKRNQSLNQKILNQENEKINNITKSQARQNTPLRKYKRAISIDNSKGMMIKTSYHNHSNNNVNNSAFRIKKAQGFPRPQTQERGQKSFNYHKIEQKPQLLIQYDSPDFF